VIKGQEASVPGVRLLRAVATAGVLAVVTFGWSSAEPAGASAGSAPTVGPVPINALGHPGLCWEAGGNGSAVTLEHCDSAAAGQQWSLTSDGVVMNGNGYCLEAPTGQTLYIDFAGQCAGDAQGSRSQIWRYRAGQLTSAGTAACAAAGGPDWPGTQIVKRACPAPGHAPRWSIGYSAVTVAAASATGAAGSGSGAAGGTFGASVTVANAASAQTAYGVAVTFSLPRHPVAASLHVTSLHVTGGGTGWSCDIRALTCTGTLPSGASGRIAIAGHLPARARPGDSYTVRARASVAETSQRPGTTRTAASLTVAVHAAAPGAGAAPSVAGASASRSPLPLVAAVAGALLLGGGLLILITRRTRAPAKHSLPR